MNYCNCMGRPSLNSPTNRCVSRLVSLQNEDAVSWKESHDSAYYTRGKKKEVRGDGREDLTLQIVCQQNITNRCFSRTCTLLWGWNFDSIIRGDLMNKYFFSHWVSGEGSFHPHQVESHPVMNGLNCLVCYFSLLRIFLALQCGKHRGRERGRGREWWLSEWEGGSQNSSGRQCVRSGGPGALWMAHAEWVPWRGDQAHWEQVTRGRECFCSAFGPLTHCPTSALAALKPNIFIWDALKREGGAAVRIKSSSCWQLHLLLKGSYDRRTMSLRRPALGEGLSYVDMLGI